MNAQTALLGIALLLVAALTAGGMAMRSVSRIWLCHWVERQLRGSRAALAYLEKPHRLVIAASATIALILVLSGELLAMHHAEEPTELAEAITVFAASVILLGQLLPRALARRFAPAIAAALSPVMELAAIIASPIVAAGRLAARPFVRVAPPDHDAERGAIQDLLREGELEGVGERAEMEIITGLMEFGEKRVRDVMIPRSDIFAIPLNTSPRRIAEEFATSEFSRVPVYDGTLDRVVGMMHAFDVLKTHGESMPEVREVTFAVDEMPCSELLFRMLRVRRHLAIVRDGAGRTVGLVSLEDLLEELVGDIRDEHDEPAPRAAV